MNVFEAVDVISLIRNGAYDDLALSVGEALQKRSPVSWPQYRFYPFSRAARPVSSYTLLITN